MSANNHKPHAHYDYDRNKDSTVDICLSCTNENCIGVCDKIRIERTGKNAVSNIKRQNADSKV